MYGVNNMRVYREPAGKISEEVCWVAIRRPFMYGPCPSLLELLIEIILGWNKESNIVG
jgi:hypothetical protein